MSLWVTPNYHHRPVAVIGAGLLGRRIAGSWIAGGFDVNITDTNPEQCSAAIQFVEASSEAFSKLVLGNRGRVQSFGRLEDAVKDAWLVVEAVPEDLDMKSAVFAELERAAPTDCLLASNSSSYKSSEMLGRVSTDTKQRILNMHYMMPPEGRVVELMSDGHTPLEVLTFLKDRLTAVGLHPVIVHKESTGFVFNRLWAAIKRETLMILSEGVSTPEELDGLWRELYGTKMGPCEMMDAIGLDTVATIEEHYIKERKLPSVDTVDFLRSNYLEQGKLGVKTGKGGLYPPGHTIRWQ